MEHTRLGRRVGKWIVLVAACALPLFWFTWNKDRPVLHLAELVGIVIWIAVMVGLDGWLLKSGRERASLALGRGALVFATIQGLLSLVSLTVLMYLYLPLFLMLKVGPIVFLEKSPFISTIILTVESGFSALIYVMLLGAISLLFGRRGRLAA